MLEKIIKKNKFKKPYIAIKKSIKIKKKQEKKMIMIYSFKRNLRKYFYLIFIIFYYSNFYIIIGYVYKLPDLNTYFSFRIINFFL